MVHLVGTGVRDRGKRHWNRRHTRLLKSRCASVVCDRCKINLAPSWHHWDPSRLSSNRISHSSQSWEYQNLGCPQSRSYAFRLCYKSISINSRDALSHRPIENDRCPDCGGGRADNRRPSPWRQGPGQHPPPQAAAGILIAGLDGRRLRGRCSWPPTGQRGLSHRPRLAGFYQLLPRARRPTQLSRRADKHGSMPREDSRKFSLNEARAIQGDGSPRICGLH